MLGYQNFNNVLLLATDVVLMFESWNKPGEFYFKLAEIFFKLELSYFLDFTCFVYLILFLFFVFSLILAFSFIFLALFSEDFLSEYRHISKKMSQGMGSPELRSKK